MDKRTIEDRLREEYFELLPDIRRVREHVEAEVKYLLLPISRQLDKYERLVVTSRIKECESALEALRRRPEGKTFDRDRPDLYTLNSLNDLAGIRILAFPSSRLTEIDSKVRNKFAHWESDPVRDSETDEILGFKYHGYCDASIKVRGEVQIVPMLTGLFWEVEHSTIYKPTPSLKGVARHPEMRKRTHEVLKALRAFEENFEKLIGKSTDSSEC